MITLLIILGSSGFIGWFCMFVVRWMVDGKIIWPFKWAQDLAKYRKFTRDTEHTVLLKGGKQVRRSEIPVIPFDQFHDMYLLAPHKYTRGKDWRDKPLLYLEYRVTADRYEYPDAVFTFSFLDWKRYFKWLKAKEKVEAISYERGEKIRSTQNATDSLRAMLQDVQRDIDKCREQADQEKQEAADTFVEVTKRMKERGDVCSSGDTSSPVARPTSAPADPCIEEPLVRMIYNHHVYYIDDDNSCAYVRLRKGE